MWGDSGSGQKPPVKVAPADLVRNTVAARIKSRGDDVSERKPPAKVAPVGEVATAGTKNKSELSGGSGRKQPPTASIIVVDESDNESRR